MICAQCEEFENWKIQGKFKSSVNLPLRGKLFFNVLFHFFPCVHIWCHTAFVQYSAFFPLQYIFSGY